MRITSGIYKNREIKSPNLSTTHPMGERERLALFNSIGNDLTDLTVLDAYAGSGSLGLEALSRGAASVTFVEKSGAATRCIAANLKTLKVTNAKIIHTSVHRLNLEVKYDLILADPPYDRFAIEDIMVLVPLLSPTGLLVLSHPGEPPVLPGLVLRSTRHYAAAHISIYHQ
ncbi:RsmD family RNA methyltransferase [Candidatus Saccharibacteria bacterium]|nr:RsmD family RNA methyltransferase [Candidatus Saccharibacteria bacterium]